jgi:hypothetical protein
MTKDIIIGQRLFDVMKMYNDGMKDCINGYLKRGKAIYKLKKEKLWIRDCAGVPSFKFYVEHELKISISQAHRLEQVYREVGKALEQTQIPIDISTIVLLLPTLHDKTDEEKIEILEANKDLPIEAIRNNLLEANGDGHKATDVCNHDETEAYERCVNCGKFLRAT